MTVQMTNTFVQSRVSSAWQGEWNVNSSVKLYIYQGALPDHLTFNPNDDRISDQLMTPTYNTFGGSRTQATNNNTTKETEWYLTESHVPSTRTASATGTATWAAMRSNQNNKTIICSVGVSSSGHPMELSTVNLVSGQNFQLVKFRFHLSYWNTD